ncbi:anti-anti-sigma factor [Streptomyces maremycinicus]|nr:anti-anti-sigma factor [Streptomyces sp. B9173]
MSDLQQEERPGRLSFQSEVADGVLVVSVRGEIDHEGKAVLSQALEAGGGAPPPRIVLDLGEVTFMDSAGINVLVSAHQTVSAAGGWLRIAAAREPVLHVLQLVGIDAVITCHPTLEQALSP